MRKMESIECVRLKRETASLQILLRRHGRLRLVDQTNREDAR